MTNLLFDHPKKDELFTNRVSLAWFFSSSPPLPFRARRGVFSQQSVFLPSARAKAGAVLFPVCPSFLRPRLRKNLNPSLFCNLWRRHDRIEKAAFSHPAKIPTSSFIFSFFYQAAQQQAGRAASTLFER